MSNSLIRSFVAENCDGNAHKFIELMDYTDEAFRQLSLSASPTILVALNHSSLPLKTDIQVAFYHNGKQVQFCGSGLLAVAHYLDQHLGIDLNSRNAFYVNIHGHEIKLGMSESRYFISTDIQLRDRAVDSSNWQTLIGYAVLHAAMLEQGYVIIELESASNVAQLQPNLEHLRADKHPAVIVTAPAYGDAEEDYVMRYFAPQFGNPEDAATGSANLYLMKYWQNKLNKNDLVGRQLSKEGGLFYGDIRGSRVTLSGFTR